MAASLATALENLRSTPPRGCRRVRASLFACLRRVRVPRVPARQNVSRETIRFTVCACMFMRVRFCAALRVVLRAVALPAFVCL